MRRIKAYLGIGGGALLLASAIGFGGACGDKKKSTGESPGTGTESTPTAGDNAEETDADLASIDVSMLVDPCIADGLPEEACRCAGDEAKTMIGAGLLAKMAKAPADDDPALPDYYTASEIQRVMKWVDGAGIKCGLEEEE